jgi:quercetin dioxygenase-like cupin family protein
MPGEKQPFSPGIQRSQSPQKAFSSLSLNQDISQNTIRGGRDVITKRDVVVAFIAVGATLFAVGAAGSQTPVMQSSAFDWKAIPARQTDVGALRQFFRTPTATLDELECHVTTLNPGKTSHAPHQHPNEELVIVKEGTVESLVQGEWKRLEQGSVIFNASNQLHAIRNVGSTPATYHVINWKSPGMAKK